MFLLIEFARMTTCATDRKSFNPAAES